MLSVAGHVKRAGDAPQGGPTVPVVTVNEVENEPSAPVMVRPVAEGGGPHETGTVSEIGPAVKLTVGWLVSLLHSRTAPAELAAYPVPATVTTVEPVACSPEFGVTVIAGVAAPA